MKLLKKLGLPRKKSHIVTARPDEWKNACHVVGSRCGLTNREVEVLFLLSLGRNIERISGMLYISKNTVRSHAYSIYRKLKINSQQELIDVIEDAT